MNKSSTYIKAAFRLSTAFLAVSLLALSSTLSAEENCNSWSAPSSDAAKGRYAIELRTCDLTYGLSAYIEIKNPSDKRVALAYRIITNDDKYKDGDIVLAQNAITPAGNCQACAKRHAGFKSWEIVSADEVADDAAAEPGAPVPVKPAALPAFMDQPGTAPKTVASPPAKPVATKPLPEPAAEKPAVAAPIPVATPAVVPAAASVPATVEQPKAATVQQKVEAPAAEPEKKEEGFRADDGTIIPWDQMPPEFRPRK